MYIHGAFSPRRTPLHAYVGDADAMLFTIVREFLFLPNGARRERDEKAYRCVDSDDCVSRLLNKIKSVASILITLRQWKLQ